MTTSTWGYLRFLGWLLTVLVFVNWCFVPGSLPLFGATCALLTVMVATGGRDDETR